MHWLKHFHTNAQPSAIKRARGIPVTVNPQAAATPRPGSPLPMSQAQRDQRNREIRALAEQGAPLVEIAARYALHPSTVGKIVRVVNV